MNSKAATFQEIFEVIVNTHAPLRKRKIRSEIAPWLSSSIRQLVIKRMKKEAKNPNLWSNYKQLRNEVTFKIRHSIEEHYSNLIEQHKYNPKEMWKTVDKVLSRVTATTTNSSLNLCGKKTIGDRCRDEVSNHHFTTVGPKLAAQIKTLPSDDPLKDISNEPSARVKFQPVSNSQVLQYLRNLKPGKSSGPSNLPTKLVKEAAEYISQPLCQIFNSSLTSGVFPDIWKVVRVAPVFKAGTRDDLNDYRPISVHCTVSQVFERVVHDQVVNYLVEQRILVQNQYTYRKLHSIIISLIKSADD